MNTDAACKGKDAEDDDGMDSIKCMCSCPVAAQLEDPAAYCNPATPLSCLMKEPSCSAVKKDMLKGGSEADFTEGIDIHCQRMEHKCDEKGMKMEKCAGENMVNWIKTCEPAKQKLELDTVADKCCPWGAKVVECYTIPCVMLDRRGDRLKS